MGPARGAPRLDGARPQAALGAAWAGEVQREGKEQTPQPEAGFWQSWVAWPLWSGSARSPPSTEQEVPAPEALTPSFPRSRWLFAFRLLQDLGQVLVLVWDQGLAGAVVVLDGLGLVRVVRALVAVVVEIQQQQQPGQEQQQEGHNYGEGGKQP